MSIIIDAACTHTRISLLDASEPGSWWPVVGKPTGMDCVRCANRSGGVEGNFLPKFTHQVYIR